MSWVQRCVKDPFPGLSHLAGAFLAVAALVALLIRADGRVWHEVGFGIYGGTLIFMYAASALAHSAHCSPEISQNLDRIDYTAIFLLIAGTYTPICLVPLRGPWGWSLLVGIWSLAGVGISTVWLSRSRRTWARTIIYLLMGWLVVFALGEVFRTFTSAALAWLVAGGAIYSVGAIIFITDKPHLWPGRFMAHDLWHVLVLIGSGCHFMVMFDFIAPHA